MSDTHKAILDREYANEATSHFKGSLDLLSDLLNWGTFLVVRAFVSSPRDWKAICVISQLRQFLVHLDGIAILAPGGSCSTATLQLRSLIEIAYVLEWVLASDTDAKVNHLIVADLRRRRQWHALTIPGSPEAARHPDDAKCLTRLHPEHLKELADAVRSNDVLLAQPPLNAIDAKFQAFHARKGYDQPWYKVYGMPSRPGISIREISEELGHLREYRLAYSAFSRIAHGSDMSKNIEARDGKVFINPVREPQNLPEIVRIAAHLAMRVYLLVLQEYRSGEVESFRRKYAQDWRTAFLKEYDIKVTPQDTII